MGFYGNITNTARTQFQFDKIYSNRKAMEQACLTDGIYLGRFVLVEYDNSGLDGMKEVTIDDNQFYYGVPSDQTRLIWKNTFENEIVYVKNEPKYIFYKRDVKPSGARDNDPATFTQFTNGNEDIYGRNYVIDNEIYKSSRGYDSTVWQKTFVDNTEKYVMIAELNTVVPKFDIATDAPTMIPVAPHFDTQSTDVYYKLHMQNPWVVRVAEAPKGQPSDSKTKWVTVNYDPEAAEGQRYSVTEVEKNAAIYFNKAGFNERSRSSVGGDNKITMNLVSSEQAIYDDHDNTTSDPIKAKDIQELTINLPGIGNMMSDAWDIIHGPNRDDARTDDDSSLQGRLDSFYAFYGDQIPVKRASDGTIVGSKINGANNYDKDTDLLTLPDGADGTIEGVAGDDAWIETKINTSTLKSGDKKTEGDQINNSGISIHHTFHATENSTSTVNKNTGNITFEAGKYKENHIRSTNKNHNTDDKIDLYVPYVDAKGHVVGHNIETITLPYGYKTFSGDKGTGTSADNTQDTMSVTGDSWVQTTVSDDEIAITHIGPVAVTATKVDDATPNFGDPFTITDWYFDSKGHKSSSNTHTVKIPLPSLTNGTGNVVTALSLTPATGAFVETKDNISNLKLTDLKAIKADAAWIQATDDIKGAFNKIDTRLDNEITRATNAETALGERIDALDYTNASTTQFISSITQEDGQIAVTRAAAGTLVLGTASSGGTVSATHSLNSAFNAIEAKIVAEEQNRAAQDAEMLETAKTYTDNVKKALLGEGISETFDTLVEIQNWINGDGVNATELSTALAGEAQLRLNNDNTLDQKIDGVNGVLQAEITNRETAITTLTERINNLPTYTLTSGTVDGTVAFNGADVEVTGLGTAAYQNEEYFVSKTQYDSDIQTRDAQIDDLTTLVNKLLERISALENQNSPTE